MKRLKIAKAKGRWTNWSWEANARDCGVLADLLFKGVRAIGMRRRPGCQSAFNLERHDLSRNLIRILGTKLETVAFDNDAHAANMLESYEAKIAALERRVGRQALDIEFLKRGL